MSRPWLLEIWSNYHASMSTRPLERWKAEYDKAKGSDFVFRDQITLDIQHSWTIFTLQWPSLFAYALVGGEAQPYTPLTDEERRKTP